MKFHYYSPEKVEELYNLTGGYVALVRDPDGKLIADVMLRVPMAVRGDRMEADDIIIDAGAVGAHIPDPNRINSDEKVLEYIRSKIFPGFLARIRKLIKKATFKTVCSGRSNNDVFISPPTDQSRKVARCRIVKGRK